MAKEKEKKSGIQTQIDKALAERQRQLAMKNSQQKLLQFDDKRRQIVSQYLTAKQRFGEDHRVTKIYFNLLRLFEVMFSVVEEIVTVHQAMLAIDDLNYVMENAFESLDEIYDSAFSHKRTSAFYRWRQRRRIKKYFKNCTKRLESAMQVGETMTKVLGKLNFGVNNKRKNSMANVASNDESVLNADTQRIIAEVKAEQGDTSATPSAPSASSAPSNGGHADATKGMPGNLDDFK